jgi:hypothetical protein
LETQRKGPLMQDSEKQKREQLLLIRKHTKRALAELAASRDAATSYRLAQGGFLHVDDNEITTHINDALSQMHWVNQKLDEELKADLEAEAGRLRDQSLEDRQ